MNHIAIFLMRKVYQIIQHFKRIINLSTHLELSCSSPRLSIPDVLLPSITAQPPLGGLEVFQGHVRYIISQVSCASTPESPPGWTHPEGLLIGYPNNLSWFFCTLCPLFLRLSPAVVQKRLISTACSCHLILSITTHSSRPYWIVWNVDRLSKNLPFGSAPTYHIGPVQPCFTADAALNRLSTSHTLFPSCFTKTVMIDSTVCLQFVSTTQINMQLKHTRL